MKYISRVFINELLLLTDIVKLISSKISLQKIGLRYKCCCPFHKEKNPSFIVNKNFFYCFGCKIYGNAIDFLMKFNNISFLDSVKYLADFNGVKLIFDKNINFNENKFSNNKIIYFKLMSFLSKLYHNSLIKNKKLYNIKNFFIKRNLNFKIIKKFFIGYSSLNLIKYLLKYLSKKDLNFLIKFGILVKDKNNHIYDRLNNRIIFPIFDIYDRVIAFGGRSINDKNILKYINTSKNIFFSKKRCLYGLNYIRNMKTKINSILIVEGYIDVITLHQYNFSNTVGLLGSCVNSKQIKILYFYTNILIFCFDGDEVGMKSIKKTLKLLLFFVNEIKKSYFIFLPKGYDPDLLIKNKGKKIFSKYIKKAKSIFYVLFKIYLLKGDIFFYERKIYTFKKILSLINRIKSPVIKFFLNRELQLKTGIENVNLNYFKYKKIKFKNNKFILIIRYLISLLLKNLFLSKLVNIYDYILNFNKIPVLKLFLNIVNLCVLNKIFVFNEILKKFSKNFIRFYLEYLFLKNYFSINIDYKLYFLNFLEKLKIFLIDFKLNNILSKKIFFDLNLEEKKKVWYLIKLKNFKKHILKN